MQRYRGIGNRKIEMIDTGIELEINKKQKHYLYALQIMNWYGRMTHTDSLFTIHCNSNYARVCH